MSKFAPCPKCSSARAEQMTFTWWGGLLGPRLLTHVRCAGCGTQYNGKTGQSNTGAIIAYSVVVGVIAAVLGFVLFVMLSRL
jgi:hypothetical protein